jgi:hypothetical protein
MKTFINAARIAVVTLMFASLTAFGFGGCCKKEKCAPRTTCNTKGCKLNPEPVKIRKTCDHPGYYKQVCHLEYVPCEGKEEIKEAYPIYLGCFDETGHAINGGGSVSSRSNGTAFTQDVKIDVEVPAVYSK